MKKTLLVFAILTSMLSVVNISQANADCSANNPCGTWAVLDNQGVVTNVIVCQASVCGGGSFGGQTVVPQVAPNPVTHDPYGTGSYIGNPDQGTEVRYSEGTFIITENTSITNTVTEVDGETTTISEVQIPVSARSFRYEDTIGKMYGEVIMDTVTFDETSQTNVSVKKTNLINTIQESTGFTERKTSAEIEQVFVNNNLNLLLSKVQTLISLLGTWVK
jgi:hypothetical protein